LTDKILIGIEYVCSREGFRQKSCQKKIYTNSEPAETRIGCKAIMGVKKVGLRWIACKFISEHNHELLSPRSTSLLRGHRVVTRAQKNLINTLNESGVPPRKIMSVLSKESGGDYNVGCISKDVHIVLKREMHKKCTIIFLRDSAKMQVLFTQSK
jgi:hypothetical protein